ncbi:MAG: FAD-binding oxidoreductase [Candidatus Brockarchaeota archaeon]|nr:FAD-binding oxidoreductase [Candidatus Brockarchaeota archaeon]
MMEGLAEQLEEIVGREAVVSGKDKIESYLSDETCFPVRPSAVSDCILVKPANSTEVSRILRLANEKRIPVYPRGGGTGLVGGAVPTRSGIIVSLERMNRIEVDGENLMAVAEAGATLGELLKAAEEAGLSFPPHPGDEGAQIGGLVACNAGGARAVKHGVMRSFVKGLEVVLPTGEIVTFGGRLLKDNMGYSLMHLIIGSEGTLGIITRVVLRLNPKAPYSFTLLLPFNSRHDALNTVPRILRSGVTPLALEYVEKELMELSAEHLGEKWVFEGKVFLIAILAGEENVVYSEAEKLSQLCVENNGLEPSVAERRDEQESILRIRSNIYTALKRDSMDILDTTVPPSAIGKLADAIDTIAEKYGAHIPVYGHAADGNVHSHIMKKDAEKYELIKREIYETTIGLGGTISGEHGVGKIRVKELYRFTHPKKIELMKGVKRLFDPNNILNPSTVLEV